MESTATVDGVQSVYLIVAPPGAPWWDALPRTGGPNVSESVEARAIRRHAGQPTHVGWLLAAGISLLVGAVLLYISGLSRAVGAVLAPIGGGAVLTAFAVRRSQAWPSRPWLVAVAVLLLALVAYGVWLIIYSAAHQGVLV